MARTAVFAGLVVDENDQPVNVTYVGQEAFYIVDDDGFLRHIPSEDVDRQVLLAMQESVMANRDAVVSGLLEYMGQEDLFTKAAIEASIGQMDEQMNQLMDVGLPEEARQWLGMMGFRIVINVHGEVVDLDMPQAADFDEE